MKLTEPKATVRCSAELVSKTTLALPKGVKLPSHSKTTVEGVISAFPFRDIVLEPDGKGSHQLKINKAIYDAVGAQIGETVVVEITRVGEEPETRVPVDLSKALATATKAKKLWEDITPIARRDWIFWIITAKQLETRERRIKVGCSKLSSGMRRVCCFAGINWLMKNGGKKS